MSKSIYLEGLKKFFKPTLRKFALPFVLVVVAVGSMFYFGGYCDHLTNQAACTSTVISNIIQITLVLGTLGYVVSCLVFTIEEIMSK